MPITTSCPTCDRPAIVELVMEKPACWFPHECEHCGTTMLIEQTRFGGECYDEEAFVADVLPDLEDVERVDHPSGEAYIYADPDGIGVREAPE